MTTQKSLVPFEQTVGHLINIVHDGLEGGNATAAAIKAQFGPYCDCAMAAWIIDGIDNAETDPTVMNKLRELLAADPAAVIERVVRQSPPERLLRRFCQGSNLMGGYMGVTGTEILQTLQDESALCPPEPTEAPDDGFFIYDSLIGVVGTPTPPVEETYFINTVTNFPLTAKLTLPLTGYEAKWGTSEETVANVLVTNNSSTSYSVGVGWRGPTYGLALTKYTNIAAGATVNVAIQALCDTGEELTVWVNISALVLSPGNNYYFEFPYSRLPARPSTNTTSGNDFLTHMPEIGLGYMVRDDRSFLDTGPGAAPRARAEQRPDGMDAHYGSGTDPYMPLEFDTGLIVATSNFGALNDEDSATAEFATSLYSSYDDFVGANEFSNQFRFPATHFNKTPIPTDNIEMGISVITRNKYKDYDNTNPVAPNWPSDGFVVLVFDTDPVEGTANIKRSYEDGYGTAVIFNFGNNSYGATVKARVVRRKFSNNTNIVGGSLDIVDIKDIAEKFNFGFENLADEDKELYSARSTSSALLQRMIDVVKDDQDYIVNFKVRTFRDQLVLFVDDVMVGNVTLPNYVRAAIVDKRCGFYIGSFSTDNGYLFYNDPNYDRYRAYIECSDFYVKRNTHTNIPVKLIWGTRDFHLANFTEEERTSTNSLLYGSMPSTYPEWDAVKPSSGYSINWEYIDTDFRIETPNEDDYQHISVQAVVYTEDGSFVRTSFPTLDVATSANSGLVDFDASTRTGNLRFSTLSGFRPVFSRDWGSQNSPILWDNDIWAVELQILYKGIKLGHITIMSYAPTSQTQGNGAYMYGVGFTIFSAMIYN